MQPFPPTVVIRHRLENLKKCSLRGLEIRPDFLFVTYPYLSLPPLEGYVVLDLNAPPLSIADAGSGLLLIDATWRYAAKISAAPELQSGYRRRSLPSGFRTAYPRRQNDCPDPERGLASIEALYLAYLILERDPAGLLDHYYWKELFLQTNQIIN